MADAYDFWAERLPRDVQKGIDQMWVRFAKTAPALKTALDQGGHAAAKPLVEEALGDLSSSLEYDFAPGPAGAGSHTFVLSAGMKHEQRVLARAALDNAPDLRGWAFADSRPAVDDAVAAPDEVVRRDAAKAFKLTGIDPSLGAHRRITLSPSGGTDEKIMARQARLTFSALLGEDVARDWMGQVEQKKRGLLGRIGGRGGKADGRWCSDFRDACNTLIGEAKGKLPDTPFMESDYERRNQVMYQANRLEPDPGWRHDTITGYTTYKQMAQARMVGDPLAAVRFSRFGESFCGLKVARTPDFHFDEIEQRIALAEGTHMMLASRDQGGVTGEASGRGHVYIDIALTDLDGAVETLSEFLEKIEFTGPAWLIFDEAGLTGLSVPLTARTPATPKASYG